MNSGIVPTMKNMQPIRMSLLRKARFGLSLYIVGFLALGAVSLAAGRAALDTKDTGAYISAQSAADALKDFAKTDGAFLAAGLLKDSYSKSADLSTMLLYPEDVVVVVKLSGSQIKQAFERSASLYPQPNTSFLQLSGFEVTFSKGAPVGRRVTSASFSGSALEDSKDYTIAMPASLGRGGLGYFKIWDRPNIVKTYEKTTVEGVLQGKHFADSSPRWSVVP